MEEKQIKSYLKQQVHLIVERGASEPDACLDYFADREVRDEAILGLLAVSTFMSGEIRANFSTSAEARASLTHACRSKICREFRRELQACLRHVAA